MTPTHSKFTFIYDNHTIKIYKPETSCHYFFFFDDLCCCAEDSDSLGTGRAFCHCKGFNLYMGQGGRVSCKKKRQLSNVSLRSRMPQALEQWLIDQWAMAKSIIDLWLDQYPPIITFFRKQHGQERELNIKLY